MNLLYSSCVAIRQSSRTLNLNTVGSCYELNNADAWFIARLLNFYRNSSVKARTCSWPRIWKLCLLSGWPGRDLHDLNCHRHSTLAQDVDPMSHQRAAKIFELSLLRLEAVKVRLDAVSLVGTIVAFR
jgi:hypothetical protein